MVYEAYKSQELSGRKSVSDSLVWISILVVVMIVVCWYGAKEGWFAGQANLKGFVVDDYSHAFSSATVALIDLRGNQAYTAGIGADGRFEFAGVRPGKYLLSLNTDYGKYPGALDVFLKRDSTAEYKVIVEQSWFTQQQRAARSAAIKQASSGGG